MYDKFSMMILLMIMNQNKSKNDSVSPEDINTLGESIDIQYAMGKIEIMKRIGPYFPENLHPILNKSIIITERVLKTYEVMNFIQGEEIYIDKAIPVENNKERLGYISAIIQKELKKGHIKDMGIALETILSMERYNKILTILMPIMADPDIINNPDRILDLMKVFMDGKDNQEKEKMGDIIKMLGLINTLDSPKEETPS